MEECDCWNCDKTSPFQNPIDLVRADCFVTKFVAGFRLVDCSAILYHQTLPQPGRPVLCVVSARHVVHLNATEYELRQLHWHCPGEHLLDHVLYPLEMHFVFRSILQDVCVLAVLFREGSRSSPLVSQVLNHQPLDLTALDVLPVFALPGSLTSGDDKRAIQWLVLEQVQLVATADLEQLRGNAQPARVLQPRNNRMIVYSVA